MRGLIIFRVQKKYLSTEQSLQFCMQLMKAWNNLSLTGFDP